MQARQRLPPVSQTIVPCLLCLAMPDHYSRACAILLGCCTTMLAGLGLQRTGNTLSSELGVACGACARARSPAFNSQAAAIDSAMMFGTCALAGQQAWGDHDCEPRSLTAKAFLRDQQHRSAGHRTDETNGDARPWRRSHHCLTHVVNCSECCLDKESVVCRLRRAWAGQK